MIWQFTARPDGRRTTRRTMVSAAVLAATLVVAATQGAAAQTAPGPKVDEEVLAEIAARGTARTLVIARQATGSGETQPVSAAVLSQALTQVLRSEAPILRESGMPGVLTAGLTRSAVDALAARSEVQAIRFNRLYGHIVDAPSPARPTPGVARGRSSGSTARRPTDSLIQIDRLQGNGWLGEGVTIAVIDDGLDAAHPMFANALAGEACFSQHSPEQGLASLCRDQKDRVVGPGAASFCLPDPEDCSHGTHVAGIALGRPVREGDMEVAGVAPRARLLMIKATSRLCVKNEGCDDTFTTPSLLAAIQHVLDNVDAMKIRVVNLSLGGGSFAFACDASHPEMALLMRKLMAKGVTVVAASGNRGEKGGVGSPACLSGVVAIGSIDQDGQVSSYSNAAFKVDLLAPGRDVLSAAKGGGLVVKDGTSMAAPYAAGVIAALYPTLPDGFPATLVTDALKRTGRYIRDPRNDLQFPVIQSERALEALVRTRRAAPSAAAAASTPPPAAAPPGPAPAPAPVLPAPAVTAPAAPTPTDLLRSTAPR